METFDVYDFRMLHNNEAFVEMSITIRLVNQP
jgi:hypothetical protein